MKYKTYIERAAAVLMPLTLSVLAFVSCVKYPEAEYADIENRSLRAWMEKNRPELLGNYQENGGYYVEVLNEGVGDSVSIRYVIDSVRTAAAASDEDADGCWVSFDMTARDIHGRVCLTRNLSTARMQGTFTRYTHYTPYVRFVGSDNASLMEGTYLALKSRLTLGEQYISDNGLQQVTDGRLEVRGGTHLRLYLPSSIAAGESEVSGNGGYEGEYTLNSNRPMIVDIEIKDRINNPVAYEAYLVDAFGENNGGVSPVKDDSGEESAASLRRRTVLTRTDSGDDAEEEDDGMFWRHACDTIPGLLVSKKYVPDPDKVFNFNFSFSKDESGESGSATFAPYADHDIYADMDALNRKIEEALLDRFGEGSDDGEVVGTEGTAKIWYVTRLFDGFVVDSNIEEVRRLVYGYESSSHSSISYTPEDDKDEWVTAWYYAVPEMKRGSWTTILATSTFAYGSSGRSGTTTTSSDSSAYSYIPYLNYGYYMNSMYGYGYSDMYYYNMYNMANYYNTLASSSTTETTTEISSEVLPFTPLIFQIYIEE